MNLSEMHVWFRQYAQQMGMQNVRAILPEQIDLLINTSITDTINQIITQNIGVTNDRIISDNSKIGQINALKTLYTVKTIGLFDYTYSALKSSNFGVDSFSDDMAGNWQIQIAKRNKNTNGGIELTINFTVDNTSSSSSGSTIGISGKTAAAACEEIKEYIDSQIDTHYGVNSKNKPILNISYSSSRFRNIVTFEGYSDSEIEIHSFTGDIGKFSGLCTPSHTIFELDSDGIHKALLKANDIELDTLFYVDFAIDYKSTLIGMLLDGGGAFYVNNFTSKYFPVRLIDDAFLADVLNDFILSPRLRSPILTINANAFELYFDKFSLAPQESPLGIGYVLDENLIPYTLRISYIAKPNKVKYRLDTNADNIECNLPEYLHVDILKHAVDLYRASIAGNMLGQQAQDQNQQREIARNTAVPSDGYNNSNR